MATDTNRPESIRIARYCAEDALDAGPDSMFGTEAMALRAAFAATRHRYASGGFDLDLARATIAEVFAAAAA